jgi:hypothetical protein
MIQPIETAAYGYRFRSRLEARWAVFFTTLGLRWDYEREGFTIDGTRYLPDFWLPQVCMWAEVKPVEFTPEERRLAAGLPQACLMLVGLPDYRSYYTAQNWDVYGQDFILGTQYLNEKRFYGATGREAMQSQIEPDMTNGSALKHDTEYQRAVEAALSARFEHGEGPESLSDILRRTSL